MQPSKLLPFIFIAAWEVPASAQSAASITGEEVIQAVDDVTTLSSELTTVVGSISTATDAFYIGPVSSLSLSHSPTLPPPPLFLVRARNLCLMS